MQTFSFVSVKNKVTDHVSENAIRSKLNLKLDEERVEKLSILI